MKEITIDAVVENLGVVTDFIDDFLDENDCPIKAKMKIDIAIDEVFSNISYYAYGDAVGQATIKLEIQDNPKAVSITFIDGGVPYNPLEKKDPDTTLSADEQKIGGLGIYMVKKSMNEMLYVYSENKNQLTIKKYF